MICVLWGLKMKVFCSVGHSGLPPISCSPVPTTGSGSEKRLYLVKTGRKWRDDAAETEVQQEAADDAWSFHNKHSDGAGEVNWEQKLKFFVSSVQIMNNLWPLSNRHVCTNNWQKTTLELLVINLIAFALSHIKFFCHRIIRLRTGNGLKKKYKVRLGA